MGLNENFRCLSAGLPEDIARMKAWGDFDGAVAAIDRRLAGTLPEALRRCLTVQREMIRRTPADFPLDMEAALALAGEHIPNFTRAEFDELLAAGKIKWIYVMGERRFFGRWFETLCKVEPGFARRAGVTLPGVESASGEAVGLSRLDAFMAKMKAEGVARNRIRVRASLRVKDEAFRPGLLRAHLPIPRACDAQSDILIERVFPQGGVPAPETALQRTICWEEDMRTNHEFLVEYSWVRSSVFRDTEHMTAAADQPSFHTEETAPHILFTPLIRSLAAELSQGAEGPLERARRFYDFITLKMRYSFMPAYFTLEHIAEDCARNMTGDCGVFAMLFMALCRCSGIPACWESGLTAEPDFCGAHDWTRIFVAPHGWLYVDPSYGTAAVRAENEERRRFYFGNIDAWRMAANAELQAEFHNPMRHWRADPCDNQLGEMETAERGLLYEEFVRTKEVLSCEAL